LRPTHAALIDSTRFVPMTEQHMHHHTENGEIVKRIVLR
jgi:hypothetical protein